MTKSLLVLLLVLSPVAMADPDIGRAPNVPFEHDLAAEYVESVARFLTVELVTVPPAQQTTEQMGERILEHADALIAHARGEVGADSLRSGLQASRIQALDDLGTLATLPLATPAQFDAAWTALDALHELVIGWAYRIPETDLPNTGPYRDMIVCYLEALDAWAGATDAAELEFDGFLGCALESIGCETPELRTYARPDTRTGDKCRWMLCPDGTCRPICIPEMARIFE